MRRGAQEAQGAQEAETHIAVRRRVDFQGRVGGHDGDGELVAAGAVGVIPASRLAMGDATTASLARSPLKPLGASPKASSELSHHDSKRHRRAPAIVRSQPAARQHDHHRVYQGGGRPEQCLLHS